MLESLGEGVGGGGAEEGALAALGPEGRLGGGTLRDRAHWDVACDEAGAQLSAGEDVG